MNRVRLRAVEFRRSRYIGSNDVNFLPAQPSEVVVEGHRRPALGGQEQLGEHQERRFHWGIH